MNTAELIGRFLYQNDLTALHWACRVPFKLGLIHPEQRQLLLNVIMRNEWGSYEMPLLHNRIQATAGNIKKQ
jgi:hypothetical protein